jgi:ribosomal protein L24E
MKIASGEGKYILGSDGKTVYQIVSKTNEMGER